MGPKNNLVHFKSVLECLLINNWSSSQHLHAGKDKGLSHLYLPTLLFISHWWSDSDLAGKIDGVRSWLFSYAGDIKVAIYRNRKKCFKGKKLNLNNCICSKLNEFFSSSNCKDEKQQKISLVNQKNTNKANWTFKKNVSYITKQVKTGFGATNTIHQGFLTIAYGTLPPYFDVYVWCSHQTPLLYKICIKDLPC